MKFLAFVFRYDYGDSARGDSTEKTVLIPAIKKVLGEIDCFWLEDHGYPNDMPGLQKSIIEYADSVNPDIIFFMLMRCEVAIETIGQLSKKYRTVNWFCDDQWRFDTFTRLVAPQLTWSITMDKYSLPRFKKIGCDRVILSQWAASDYQVGLDPLTVLHEFDVSFVGGKNSTRAWMVHQLEKRGYRVACFGLGWPNGKVSYQRMRDIFYRSRINLNLSNSVPRDPSYFWFVLGYALRALIGFNRKHDGGYVRSLRTAAEFLYYSFFSKKRIEQIKARNFEIPGFGGFQLSQFALEIEDYYVPGQEIALFSGVEELTRQIDYFLSFDDERRQIAQAGYVRTVEYTYDRRWEKIMEAIGK